MRKTFTMNNVLQFLNKPTAIIANNKTLAGQLFGEFKEFFQIMRRNILSPAMKWISNQHWLELFGVTCVIFC